ncbi:unnamed protein product [Fraxinus pennsylvanica]|uniref:RING-type E3 ubiquitin transferase n=1 Tax=Fraxinus pennsylvanica TaxID=56036 RepID=A0AAD1YYP7_9LAMI|nr:unnamed protein product [Fraxinus pennsylvanica]
MPRRSSYETKNLSCYFRPFYVCLIKPFFHAQVYQFSSPFHQMADDENSGLVLKLIIFLIAAASAAVFVTIYHCITAGNIHVLLRFRRNPPPRPTFVSTTGQPDPQFSIETSVAELLPTHKFQDTGLIGVDDNMCAVCLSEFEEDEELRTLPECKHSFHVQCIDMWLYSHSNCPMCRTVVLPSPLMLSQLLDSNSGTESARVDIV